MKKTRRILLTLFMELILGAGILGLASCDFFDFGSISNSENGISSTAENSSKEQNDSTTDENSSSEKNDSAETHKHTYNETITAPTCTEQGYTTYTCSCGYSYVDTYLKQTGHNYVNGVCERCNKTYVHGDGLEYTLKEDGESYSVSGIGSCMDKDLIIPSSYEGLPVTAIDDRAFDYCNNLTSVIIPDSVTSIGGYAFHSCRELSSVIIGESVTSIGESAFSGNSNLSSISIPDGIISIGSSVFDFSDHLIYNEYDNAYYLGNDNNPYLVLIEAKNTEISSCTIHENTKIIYRAAFYGCSNLTNLVISDSVTLIDFLALDGCESLVYNEYDNAYYLGNSSNPYGVLIKAKNTEISACTIHENTKVILGSAFENCSNLKSIEIPNSVLSIGIRAFRDCHNITSVLIGDGVFLIGQEAFYDCYRLTSVKIGDGVVFINENAFGNCIKAIEVYNKSSLTITAGSVEHGQIALYAKNVYTSTDGASKLSTDENGYIIYTDEKNKILMGYTGTETRLILPDEITEIYSRAFAYSNLISVEIPDSVTTIGTFAFLYCNDMVSIEIPDSVTLIGDFAFSDCNSLYKVINHSQLTFTLGESDNGFVANYAKILVDKNGNITYKNEDAIEYIETADNFLFQKEKDAYTLIAYLGMEETVTLPSDIDGNTYEIYHMRGIQNVIISAGVTAIGHEAFSDCDSLTSVVIGDGVTTIGYEAFFYCDSLTSVVIGNDVTTISSEAFRYCFGLQFNELENARYLGSVDNPYFALIEVVDTNLSSYTIHSDTRIIAGRAFYGCSSLTSMVIPDSITAIGGYAFHDCDSLTSVVIPDSVTTIGAGVFTGCSSLTSVVIPDRVTTIGDWAFYGCSSLTSVVIPDRVTTIGEYAFYGCASLTSVVIPDRVTSIGEGVFNGCRSLTSVVIPDSVTTIGAGAFDGCRSLVSVVIPDSVTTIGTGMFSVCRSLTSVVIGESVTTIGRYAFGNCTSLTDVYYKGTAEEWVGISIDSFNQDLTSATIYYYSETKPTISGNYWHYNENGEVVVW